MSIALIAGASGLVGGKLLALLLVEKKYTKVISIGRRELDISHPKLDQYIIDFNNLEALKEKSDTIFCCLGTTIKKAGSKNAFRKVDFEYPLLLAKYGLQVGAKAFHIITAMGANAKAKIFYNKVKGQVEDESKQLKFEELHIYRPSLLLGNRKENRNVEKISQALMQFAGFLFIGFLKNYKAISANSVAQFMLAKAQVKIEGSKVYLSGEMQK